MNPTFCEVCRDTDRRTAGKHRSGSDRLPQPDKLSTMTKNSPLRATGSHISIIGHITIDELRARLTQTDAEANPGRRHIALRIKAERYPLSGGSRFRGSGHDVDIYAFGKDEGPLVAEVKSSKSGSGFATIDSSLANYDALILRRNNTDPRISLPWRVWARLPERVRQ